MIGSRNRHPKSSITGYPIPRDPFAVAALRDYRRHDRHPQTDLPLGNPQLLGAHIIGDGAAELIHIGQTLMMSNGTIRVLCDTVFNYPSLAEAYRVAANNGLDRLRLRTDC